MSWMFSPPMILAVSEISRQSPFSWREPAAPLKMRPWPSCETNCLIAAISSSERWSRTAARARCKSAALHSADLCCGRRHWRCALESSLRVQALIRRIVLIGILQTAGGGLGVEDRRLNPKIPEAVFAVPMKSAGEEAFNSERTRVNPSDHAVVRTHGHPGHRAPRRPSMIRRK